MENPQEKEFRQMVLSLSEKLTKKDTNNVVYLYELPKAYEDKEPLYVLELMQNRDLFSATKPDGLARLMKEIKQDALAKFVEKNIKKPRRKYRPTLETESDPSIRLSLQAKLEVTKIQSVITANALKQSLEMVKSTDLKRVREILKEASDVADKLCGLVKHAQGIYQCSINQPSLKEGAQPISCKQRSEDDNSIYEDTDTMTSSPTNEPCDYEYMCMTSTPRENQQHVDVSVAAQPGAQMVTGVSRKPGTKPDKPTVLPKPAKSGGTSGIRTAPPMTPQQPVIGVGDIQKRKATLKKPTTTKSPTQWPQHDHQSSIGSDVESDYTGGSFTEGEGTGDDSGIGDVRPLLKVRVGGSQQTTKGGVPVSGTYYKTLGTTDAVDGYMTVTRGEQEDDLYECPPDLLNDGVVEYVNVTKTLK